MSTTTTMTVPASASVSLLKSTTVSPLTPPDSPTRSLSPAPTRPSEPSDASRSRPSSSSTRPAKYSRPSTRYLDERPRVLSTPAIGVEFDAAFQLKDVLALPDGDERKDGLLQELAYEISARGVAFFPNQDLTQEDLEALALALGKASGTPEDSDLHIHPTAALGEDGRPKVGTISNVPDKNGRKITFRDERSQLQSAGWHTDVSFEPRPARYSMLRMHTLPPTGGDTLFSSAYAHYDMLSEPLKEFLSKLKSTHSGAMFRHQARRHGFDLHLGPRGAPENVGDDFEASHPIIRTNAVTGWHTLFVNQTFTERIEGLGIDESKVLLEYLFKLQAQAHDAMVRYRWNKNDLAIWDNSAANHCATFDYTELRAGDRTVCIGETPVFDAEHGTSRKLATGSFV
ncbi:hypothetical protein JCM10212_004460 [Sporobolomyces blumeae]